MSAVDSASASVIQPKSSLHVAEKVTLKGAVSSELIALVSAVALLILVLTPAAPILLIKAIVVTTAFSLTLAVGFAVSHILIKRSLGSSSTATDSEATKNELEAYKKHVFQEEAKYQTTATELTATIAKLTSENERLKQANPDLSDQLPLAEDDDKEESDVSIVTMKHYKEIKAKNDELEQANFGQSEKLKELEKATEEFEKKLKEVKEERTSIEKELREALDKTQIKCENYSKQMKVSKEEKEKLQEQIDELTESNIEFETKEKQFDTGRNLVKELRNKFAELITYAATNGVDVSEYEKFNIEYPEGLDEEWEEVSEVPLNEGQIVKDVESESKEEQK